MGNLIEPHANRSPARPLGLEYQSRIRLKHAVDEGPIPFAIAGLRDMIPAAQRKDLVRSHEGLAVAGPAHEGVEIPGVSNYADFEEHPGLALTRLDICWNDRFKMEPTLLERAAIGPEERLNREGFGPGERMNGEVETITYAIEGNRSAHARHDHARPALGSRR